MKEKGVIRLALATGITALVLAANASQTPAQQAPTRPSGPPSTMAQTGQLNARDHDFLVKAARIDMEEVQAGKLAQQKGTSQAVRHFGEHMVNDHSEANTGLGEIASQKGLALPMQLSQEQNSALQHLEGLSGAEFDKTFASDMVKGHEQAVKEFQKAATDVSDTDLRAWAQTALPLLQEHLRMAENMQKAVKNEKTS